MQILNHTHYPAFFTGKDEDGQIQSGTSLGF